MWPIKFWDAYIKREVKKYMEQLKKEDYEEIETTKQLKKEDYEEILKQQSNWRKKIMKKF